MLPSLRMIRRSLILSVTILDVSPGASYHEYQTKISRRQEQAKRKELEDLRDRETELAQDGGAKLSRRT